jgi:hypothetical protein
MNSGSSPKKNTEEANKDRNSGNKKIKEQGKQTDGEQLKDSEEKQGTLTEG